ncbi:hypothetical protein AQ490_04215 [Wenjunlia vitaminophila]|uniref:Uncharacterized protein n=1 Tax=Wenjunlia vitaminophila TaxID=76728 RepID=A0A0T6LQV5_WENVI|nr:L,D-transpeptidase [Wenjunlia vitaminophila]KRV48461.1 hypothetical protein AQ490_04215 [Wenjunlia vitaminophila]
MARQVSSRVVVTGLVVSALAAVSALAIQANGATSGDHTAGHKPSSDSSSTAPGKPRAPKAPSLPPHSGTGKRIVYSLKLDRVWIVNARGKPLSTFAVWPGTLDPPIGLHRVTYLLPNTTGSDNLQVEHVIYFSTVENTWIAFSAALDGSSPKPVPGKKTGGVRMRRSDSAKLWDFAAIGTPVIVTP